MHSLALAFPCELAMANATSFLSMGNHPAEDDLAVEGTPFPTRSLSSPPSLSRKNLCTGSTNGSEQEEFIYYRLPGKNSFDGPFTEAQCQSKYREGRFYDGIEFMFRPDGPVETLGSLKARNGSECPFLEDNSKSVFSPTEELSMKTMMGRLEDLERELKKIKKENSTNEIVSKIENDSLKNRVKELMEKDSLNEQSRHEMELRMEDMEWQIGELRESYEMNRVAETTTADLSIDLIEVRNELRQLQDSVHSIDQFTLSLSQKVEKLKGKYKMIDLIGEGLNNKDGVFDRLAYLEKSVDEVQAAIEKERKGEEETVLPPERSEGEAEEEGSIPEHWYSPKERLSPESEVTLNATPSEATATIAVPGPEKIPEVGVKMNH